MIVKNEKYQLLFLAALILGVVCGCSKDREDLFLECLNETPRQLSRLVSVAERRLPEKDWSPQSVDKNGNVVYASIADWTSGFFPGCMWYMYNITHEKKWIDWGFKFTDRLDSVNNSNWRSNIGIVMTSSYLNRYRVVPEEKDKRVIIDAAKFLTSLFCPRVGVIKSWNVDDRIPTQRSWKCPVAIGSLMNVELLFAATEISGDSLYYDMAITHVNKILKNHFRVDNSCYQVVDYDTKTGDVRSKETLHGYDDESSWARGQAWALYGYTMCYRYTHNPIYLSQAKKIYDYIFSVSTMPLDLIPYWDYHAFNIPNEPRDASAATIVMSALYEMYTLTKDAKYRITADLMMQSLCATPYLNKVGSNGNFILCHSVGNMKKNKKIDAPAIYADYYFLESAYRKINIDATLNRIK